MSNNKDDNSALGVAVGGFIACFAIFGAIAFAVLSFVSLVLTVFCFLAWKKPYYIGSTRIEPYEAQAFVSRGFDGACYLTLFACFCTIVFDCPEIMHGIYYYLLGGYAAGSLGWPLLFRGNNEQAAQPVTMPTATQPKPAALPSAAPSAPKPKPEQGEFRFATWDDEEERA